MFGEVPFPFKYRLSILVCHDTAFVSCLDILLLVLTISSCLLLLANDSYTKIHLQHHQQAQVHKQTLILFHLNNAANFHFNGG